MLTIKGCATDSRRGGGVWAATSVLPEAWPDGYEARTDSYSYSYHPDSSWIEMGGKVGDCTMGYMG
jgi:hypothetical protein